MSDHWLETYKSLITLSIEGFKFSALANGGAAVALLAYLGNVAGKGVPVPNMSCPMSIFMIGLTVNGLAMLFAYLTQFALLNETNQHSSPIVKHTIALWIAIILFACSLIAFCAGALLAVNHFR